MELAGIEPASKSPSITASSATAYVLLFPQPTAHKQADCLGSFIDFLLSQSFDNRVFRIRRRRCAVCGPPAPDEQRLGC